MKNPKELVVPYCGGCGHLYFNEPKVTVEKAEKIAETRRCRYCHEEEDSRPREPNTRYWSDF